MEQQVMMMAHMSIPHVIVPEFIDLANEKEEEEKESFDLHKQPDKKDAADIVDESDLSDIPAIVEITPRENVTRKKNASKSSRVTKERTPAKALARRKQSDNDTHIQPEDDSAGSDNHAQDSTDAPEDIQRMQPEDVSTINATQHDVESNSKQGRSSSWTKEYIHELIAACTKVAQEQAASLANALPTVDVMDEEFESVKKIMSQPVVTAAAAASDNMALLSKAETYLLDSEAIGERTNTTALCVLRNRGMYLAMLRKHVWPSILIVNQGHNKTRVNKADALSPTRFSEWVQERMQVKQSKNKKGWNTQYIRWLERLAEICTVFPPFIYAHSADPEITVTRVLENIKIIHSTITGNTI
jgi:hypothetical protein